MKSCQTFGLENCLEREDWGAETRGLGRLGSQSEWKMGERMQLIEEHLSCAETQGMECSPTDTWYMSQVT